MKTAAESRLWLHDMMEDTQISIAELSRRSKVHKSTIHRALSDDYQFVPSSRTMDKLWTAIFDYAREKGIVNQFQFENQVAQHPDRVPIVCDIGEDSSGYRKSPSELAPFTYNEKIQKEFQFAGIISDNSANLKFDAGDILHLASHQALKAIAVRPGDHLVVAGENIDTDQVRFRVVEVIRSQSDGLLLRAPTSHEALAYQDVLDPARTSLHGLLQYSIFALIIGFYRPTHFLAQ